MNLRSALIPAAALGLAVALAFTPLTGAQTAPSTGGAKIAVANPAKIFGGLKEAKDYGEKATAEQSASQQTFTAKKTKVQDLLQGLQLLKADSPAYAAQQKEYVSARVEFEAWAKITEEELKRGQMTFVRMEFDKIQAAAAQVAMQKGIDIVIADERPGIPDNVTIEQLQSYLTARTILFAGPQVDISGDIAALLDAQYAKK